MRSNSHSPSRAPVSARRAKTLRSLLIGITLGAQAPALLAYDLGGSVTAIDPARGSLEIDGRQYSVSSQTRIRLGSAENGLATPFSDLRVGEYVQLETQGDRVVKIRRYRNGPPH
ncbi:hypothetical protein [Thiorhodococcus minor]|uniref:DUF5666 domain-containing protein n=1 Tax=Thiorhodococcus minor TaxID=57489 RepID=A0A6M0K4S7_9GAMM|nr:hypothetical protein [Thiorhodococcus minor]NEV64730.1 hypothetical protein [Thiorhodococcus minor]